MTDKQIEGAIKELMANQHSSIKQLVIFQRLNILLPKSEAVSYENNLRGLIVIYLTNPSPESQTSALQLLITCLKRGLFQSPKELDLANVVLNIAHNTDNKNVELQELWLKAFSALETMTGLHLLLFETRTVEIVNIIRRVIDSDASSLQKMNALHLLNKLVKDVTLDNDVQNTIAILWMDKICPLMFNLTQTNLQSTATDISTSMLPILQNRVQTECFNNFLTVVEKTYLPIMTTLVSKEDVLYSKLWIFLCKLLAIKFHQGFQVVNMLLTVVEGGFKSQNTDIRLHAFYCWQSLIDSFLLNPDTFFTEKRFKLLTLPLKANNGRSENLVQVKFLTWCKLLNALDAKNISFDRHGVLEQFLQFCFGPLCEQPLISWISHANQVSQGKKYSSVHLMSCKALLQLFGMKMYIDNELQAKLEYFSFKNPKVSIENVNSKFLIDSVGECCFLLSQMQNSDRFECAAINEALWKSLFYRIDHLKDENLKQKCCEQLSALILALTAVARKRTSLITFGLVPLFDIIVTNEFAFFKNEKMSELLFIPMVQAVMKKDKALLQHDVIQIFKKIFIFKTDDVDFLKFVQIVLDRFSLNVKENLHPDKLAMLQNVWLILEEQLKKHLSKLKSIKIDQEMCSLVFFDFLMWPVTVLNVPFNQEKIYLKWKELFYSFGLHTSETLLNQLGIKILQSLNKLWEKGTHNVIIANITYFIVNYLNLKEYNEEQLTNILEVFTLLKSFILTEDSSKETLKIFVKSVKKIFSNSKSHPFCLKDQILDCVTCLLSTHKNEEILEDITNFATNFPNSAQYKPDFEKLIHIMQQSGVEQSILDPIIKKISSGSPKSNKPSTLNLFARKTKANSSKTSQSDSETLEHRKRGRKQTFKSKEFPDIVTKKPKTTNDLIESNDKAEKQQILSLLGHDVETMSPVKLRGSFISPKNTETPANTDLVFVNTPYKFDPKKLTKSQREKLSKKPDDIPALYADLSQSQTQNFADSNSILESSNPFSELVESKNKSEEEAVIEFTPKSKEERLKAAENELKEAESANSLSNFKVKIVGLLSSPELQRSDAKLKNKNVGIKTIGRRKSLNTETVSEAQIKKPKSVVRRKSADSKINTDVKLIESEHKYQKSLTTKKPSKKPSKTAADGTVIKKKRGRKSKSEHSIILSENLTDPNSIDRINESDPLNTAQVDINSADLNSANIENLPFKPEKKRRGRRSKKLEDSASENESEKPEATPALINFDIDAESDPNIPDIVKIRISRELKRIKMDIKDSQDYRKNEKRKTRTSVSNLQANSDSEGRKSVSPVNNKKKTPEDGEKVSLEACEPKKTQSIEENTESEQIIEPTPEESNPNKEEFIKQCKIPVLYRLESVKPGEHLIIDNFTDVIKGPKPTSPFKILTPVEVPQKSSVCQELNFEEPEEPENSDTRTINSELLAEINEQAPEMLNIPEEEQKPEDFSCRKVLFNTTTEESTAEIHLSPPREPRTDIASSPVCVDTPTRNKELIKDTLEISPIKETCKDAEEASTSCFGEPERVGNNSPHPLKISRKKNSLKAPGGRSAHMMDMISARTTLLSPKNAKKPKEPKEICFSPTQNRIMKMMEQLEKNTEEEKPLETEIEQIKDEDILIFSKELPSPYASPSVSILKKRKHEDVDDAAVRACKRRRVNFSDPPVSSRKFIEKNARQKFSSSVKLDFVPQEARVTRSSKPEDETQQTSEETVEKPPEETVENISEETAEKTLEETVKTLEETVKTLEETVEKESDEIVEQSLEETVENLSEETVEEETVENLSEETVEEETVEKTSNEVSVITKNSDFTESLPDAQSFLENSTCGSSSSVLNWSPTKAVDTEEMFTVIYDQLKEKKIEPEVLIKRLFTNQLFELLIEQLNTKDVLQLIVNQLKPDLLKNISENLPSEMLSLIPKPEESMQQLGATIQNYSAVELIQKLNSFLPKKDN